MQSPSPGKDYCATKCAAVSNWVADVDEGVYDEARPGSSLEIPLYLLNKCSALEAPRVLVASTSSVEESEEEDRDAAGKPDDDLPEDS